MTKSQEYAIKANQITESVLRMRLDTESSKAHQLQGLCDEMLGYIARMDNREAKQAADREQAEENDRASESESIPVAELAEVLGCAPDAATVRAKVMDVPRVIASLKVEIEELLEDLSPDSEEAGPEPDADGRYEHDGKSWPACGLRDEVEVMRPNGKSWGPAMPAYNYNWQSPELKYWRYADGRDTGGGAS